MNHRLLCLCLLALFALQGARTVFANSQGDSDLVFETLENTKPKVSAVENHETDDPGWFSGTIKRIKRSISWSSIFGGSTDESQEQQELQSQEIDDSENDDHKKTDNSFDELKVGDDDENSGEPGDDDDDGDDDDGDVTEVPEVTTRGHSVGHIEYYRISFDIHEPYLQQFEDYNSGEFRRVARSIENYIDGLYRNVEGNQTAKVIKIKPTDDAFISRTIIDLASDNNDNKDEIEQILRDEVQVRRRLGDIPTGDSIEFSVFEGCAEHELTCDNKYCVPHSARCNRVNDCGDFTDERGCGHDEIEVGTLPPIHGFPDISEPTGPTSSRTLTEEPVTYRPAPRCRADDVVRCAKDHRISICADQECDGRIDCPDGEDEDPEKCGTNACATGELSCDITRCIPLIKRCDGHKDCDDETDELQCETCSSGQFKCDDSCIDISRRCDGVQDCRSGEDEHDCPPKECKEDEISCGSTGCQRGAKCDGIFDCVDGSDEDNCDICSPHQFRCSNGQCINEEQRCDGQSNCADNTDELNCVNECQPYQFRCSDGICLDGEKRCDGHFDCRDKSDEDNCHQKTCSPSQFQCDNGECINGGYKCDGYADCADSSDEKDCSCSDNQFKCSDNTCISLSQKCDGTDNCHDGSDEADCEEPKYCNSNEFQCADGNCIPSYLRCDGQYQCSDRSDELNCGCQSDEFRCGDGSCIKEYLRCDRKRDCSDGSDEELCHAPEPPKCPVGYRSCRNGQCVPLSAFCDGRADCSDSSDESDCGVSERELNLKTYPSAQDIEETTYKIGREVVFQCRDEGPLRARVHWLRANGLPLPEGSRDRNGRLEMPNIKIEHSGQYICAADGYPSYAPGAQISVNLRVDKHTTPAPPRPPQACKLNEATCSNGLCIPKNLVCDGRYDCTDGSDETRCNPHGCEPNEFRCSNKRCVLKTWVCDGEDDCGDGSDEDNCEPNPPGSKCQSHQFSCTSGNQCIPKSYHCDQERDCQDGSDEIGCTKVSFIKTPPPMIEIDLGSTLIIECTAVGVPTPIIVWRLNWGHIPEKCITKSVDGHGTLTCHNMQESDQGAYSCEAINVRGSLLATPDTIVTIKRDRPDQVCPYGQFNDDATHPHECISCFCFGQTIDCKSAELFTFHLPPPFDSHKYLGVKIDPQSGVVDIRDEPIYSGPQPRLTPTLSRNGVQAYLAHATLSQSDVIPYFAMPENYHGNQLKSYGGHLKYNLKYEGRGPPTANAPQVILSGNGYTLLHTGKPLHQGYTNNVTVRFFEGEWIIRSDGVRERPATRQEIMMALASVENILIKLQYINGHLETTLSNIEMDSAAINDYYLGRATYVEECKCPTGYTGLSCESCAPGYSRRRNGPWLGQCYKEPETCPPGTYGDPSRGIPCKECPCPLTNPSNQFGRTCKLGSNDRVICDCPPEYVGDTCERCAPGYVGNPLIPGDYCRPSRPSPSQCDERGSSSNVPDVYGQCPCKLHVTGQRCDQCRNNTFYLSSENQFGCIPCFCMGITDRCSSSNFYRDTIYNAFTSHNSIFDFKLVESLNKENAFDNGIIPDEDKREIVFRDFSLRRPDVYYWSLPPRYLGDKITAYGGNLKYTLRYVPAPGGQSSRNTAPVVELISSNHITLMYFGREQPAPNTPQTFTVPLFEQYWQRHDGQPIDREHMLMALADLKAILIKATYTTNTREAALVSVSLDIASDRNTGSLVRAYAVEECHCPVGYKGPSCEDCDAGYTRADEGIYLGICVLCNCNGHSQECDAETGQCKGCTDNTEGENCERCREGYEGDPTNNIPCRPITPHECSCDPRGSIGNTCINGQCYCKTNVVGSRCDECRRGTFGLNGSIPEGCQTCFCSGVTSECSASNLYLEQIPSQIIDPAHHNFTLTDRYQTTSIHSNFMVNIGRNEIGYTFKPSENHPWFWSLPRIFTGNHIKSYGGKLEFTQRYTQRASGGHHPDLDVIIIGNGNTIYWSNPQTLQPEIANKVSVLLSPAANWQYLEHRHGPKPASREDILRVLYDIDYILIRAKPSTDTATSFLSDITLDTAVDTYTGKPIASSVEVCRCPLGYTGTSCESCSTGYIKNNDISSAEFGSCIKCENCDGNPSEAPRVVITPNQIEVNEGEPIEIKCTASGNPTPYLHFGRTSRIALSDSQSFTNGMFYIPSAVSTDAGEYECIAENSAGRNSARILVIVHSSEQLIKPTITPPYYNGKSNIDFTLTCHTSVPVRKIEWVKRDGHLPYNSRQRNGVLYINNPRPEDSGTYECIVTSNSGTSGKEISIVSIYNEHEELPPSVRIHPESQTAIQGSTVEFVCEASGSPPPTVKWIKVSSSGQNIEFAGKILTLNNVQPHDRGVYACIATNSFGVNQARAILDIERREMPQIEIYPREPQTITEGSSAMLQCRFTAGIPHPTLSWRRQDGQPLSSNVAEPHQGVLRFNDVHISDSGNYICEASNSAGRVTAQTTITIQTIPIITIIPSNETIIVKRGHYFKLECRATGTPQPMVNWNRVLYPSSQITPYTGRIATPSVALYEITRFASEDQGVYRCIAQNNVTTVEKEVQVLIEDLPSRGDIIGEDAGSSTHHHNPGTGSHHQPDLKNNELFGERFIAPVGTRAELRCRISANHEHTPLHINWVRSDNSSLPADSYTSEGTLHIDNVQPSDAGEYHCLAIANDGRIVFTITAFLDVPYPPRITLRPPKQIVRPGDDVLIECIASGNEPITITWHPINRHMPASVRTRDGRLQFNQIHNSDAGRYRCTAVNSGGEADAVAEVIVQEPTKATITADNREQTATIGSDVTLRCIVHASYQPSIRWFRQHHALPRTSRIEGNSLRLFNVQPGDDGEYYCEISTEDGVVSDYTNLQVLRPGNPMPHLEIDASSHETHVGDNLVLHCRSSEPGDITTWFKTHGGFLPNVHVSGGTLRFDYITPENAGVYRCEARGHTGVYYKEYNVEVIGRVDKPAPQIEIKTAPQGSTIRMECKTQNIQPPIHYTWTKQGSNLPRDVDIHSRVIQLNNIDSHDAGTYVCTSSNDQTTIDVPTILVVTGIVPYFTQAPKSFIELPPLPDSFLEFTFEVSFKPETHDGLILYNGNSKSRDQKDYIMLYLENGIPAFRFNLGGTEATAQADRPVTIGQWHTIKVSRIRKKATMYVDKEGPFIALAASSKYSGLELTDNLYLGGIPNTDDLPQHLNNVDIGFVGCISQFKVGQSHQDILRDAINKQGITTCETCSNNPCENEGVCQEALSKEGYMCICPSGYSGPTCNKLRGESCSPNSCGKGRCVDNENSFECLCPIGSVGRRCERDVAIYEPAFSKNAYIAYPIPKAQRRLKLSIKMKPRDLSDGILVYCSETDEGDGDFISLAIKDRHLELRFDVGNGPTIITSKKELQAGEWVVISAMRSLSEGRLIVNGDAPEIGRSFGNHKALNLRTPLYVGGFNKHKITVNSGVGVNTGFNGCISEINVSGVDLDIIKSITDSSNVNDCSALDYDDNNEQDNEINEPWRPTFRHDETSCSSNPCKNNGQCQVLSPVEYRCECTHGYSGHDCEIAPNQCEQYRPCQNGGTCHGNSTEYRCDCNLGTTGVNCESRAELRNDVNFNGNGYLELSKSLLNHQQEDTELIALEFSTNSSDGLIFWHSQTPSQDGSGEDYIALALQNGYLEFSFDLGSGPANIRSAIPVNDGERHNVILKRSGRIGSLEVDNEYEETGEAPGITTSLNTNGNIYLGGTPNITFMTGGRYKHGFVGCISVLEIQEYKSIDFGTRAISGVNAKPCSSFRHPSGGRRHDVFVN